MKQSTVPSEGILTLQVDDVGGDLQIVGWERAEITAKTDDDELDLVVNGPVVRTRSDGDLILYVARDVNMKISSVGGDADIRALSGSLDMTEISGDLQVRNVGSIRIADVGGDMSVRVCSGDLFADSVGGDASLHEIKGDINIHVGADLYLRGAEGNVQAEVGSDAALYLRPIAGKDVNVHAGSDVLLRLPVKSDVELILQGCDDESIRVDLPDVTSVEMGMSRTLMVGVGGSRMKLIAGADVIVTSRGEEWDNMADFDPLGRDGPFSPGEFPGIPSDLHERISRRVEDATRRALEASMRAREQSDRMQHRVDAAMRRAEDKMRTAENRSMHMGIKVGRYGVAFETPRPPVPPVPPNGPIPPFSSPQQRAAVEPVTDQERLVILKMLQDKKISIQDAEKLLAALDGK
jgi:hypothetical protein